MSSNVVKVNGVEVATDGSTPTVINININQPSSLSCLLDSAKSLWKLKTPTKGGVKATAFSGEQKALGSVQFMIGLVCVSVAVVICFLREGRMYWTGSGFWTGFPFILTGVFSIIAEKRASRLWLCAASLLNLVSLGVAIGGIVVISSDLTWFWWSGHWDPDQLCKPHQDDYYRRAYETTTPEARNWRVEECKDVIGRLSNLFNGIKVMMMVATCLALCISTFSLGSSCKTLCCTSACEQEEEEAFVENDTEPLLASHPPPYEEKCAKVETI